MYVHKSCMCVVLSKFKRLGHNTLIAISYSLCFPIRYYHYYYYFHDIIKTEHARFPQCYYPDNLSHSNDICNMCVCDQTRTLLLYNNNTYNFILNTYWVGTLKSVGISVAYLLIFTACRTYFALNYISDTCVCRISNKTLQVPIQEIYDSTSYWCKRHAAAPLGVLLEYQTLFVLQLQLPLLPQNSYSNTIRSI